jgi:uncharacterized Tic20 family protein
MLTDSEKKWAAFTHLSALSQYCLPLGNFILPIVIWSSKKEQSDYVNQNGKQSLNFQLSILLYSLILGAIIVPVFIISFLKQIPLYELTQHHHFTSTEFNFGENIGLISTGCTAVFMLAVIKITEFFLIIQASVKTANGEQYKYPLTIKFLK